MKIKNISSLLLSLLFLVAYQINAVHSHQHLIEELECHLCESTKQLNANIHKPAAPVFVELTTLQSVQIQERFSVSQPLDFTQQVEVLGVDFSGLQTFVVKPMPLGYFSHAPPHTFS